MNALITYGSSHPSLGVIVGIPICVLSVTALVVAGVWLLRHDWDHYDQGLATFFGWLAIGGAAVVAVLAVLGFYPYSSQYHHWQNITGTVATTNSRFLSNDSGGTSQKFVVTFDGSEQQFGCNDTRCATVRKGDTLTITCKRSFQWFGTPGYDCNFVSMKAAQR